MNVSNQLSNSIVLTFVLAITSLIGGQKIVGSFFESILGIILLLFVIPIIVAFLLGYAILPKDDKTSKYVFYIGNVFVVIFWFLMRSL